MFPVTFDHKNPTKSRCKLTVLRSKLFQNHSYSKLRKYRFVFFEFIGGDFGNVRAFGNGETNL